MEIWQVIILATVQGAAEFLPVSSTAHLILFPWFLNFPDPGLSFDVAMHLGTFLAVIIFFWHDWLKILNFKKLFWLLVLATIPGAFFGLLLENQVQTLFRQPLLIAGAMAIFGLVLWWVDRQSKKLNDLSHLSKSQVLLIGFSQALALVPGVSRSGITIVGGMVAGLTREAAVKFSFLLSAPIIFGAAIWEMRKLFGGGGETLAVGNLGLGILISFISGFLAIKFLLQFVQKGSFLPFVIYRLILALGILLFLVVRT